MNDMENVTLQNGEIAFLQSGTVIMNVDTALELSDKLEARKQKGDEQSAEEAMENAMVLLAALFGPEILFGGKKPTVTPAPAAPVKPARDPKDDTHPAPCQDLYFPLPLVGNSPSARRHFEDGIYVYVDNYGNVFGTMGECDYRHQLASGTTQKLISGKQRLGYSNGYGTYGVPEHERVLADFSLYGSPELKDNRDTFKNQHVVTVVAIPKSAICVTKDNTRESRYRAWQNAMAEANKTLNEIIEDPVSFNRVINNCTGYYYTGILTARNSMTKKLRKKFKANGEEFPYDK